MTPEANLDLIESSVAFLTENGRQVIYDAEHFFDGFNDDADYAFKPSRRQRTRERDVSCSVTRTVDGYR